MREIEANHLSPIYLGKLGEYDVTVVSFDISKMVEVFGEGTFTLTNIRHGEDVGYPRIVERYENMVKWVVGEEDLAVEGEGKCQIILSPNNGGKAKTDTYMTVVGEAISDSGEVPEPWQPFVDTLAQVAATASAAANEASEYMEDAAEAADTAIESMNSAAEYATLANQYYLSAKEEVETFLQNLNSIVAAAIAEQIQNNH